MLQNSLDGAVGAAGDRVGDLSSATLIDANFSENNIRPSRYLPEDSQEKLLFFKDKKNNLIRPTEKEIELNPPSRSAKLRFATRNEKSFEEPKIFKKKFEKYLSLESLNV